jgi:ABC-type uncharacterized transport system involved in gliding motility auxiliary subunit
MVKRIPILLAVGILLLGTALGLSATRVSSKVATILLAAGGVAWILAVIFSWRSIHEYLLKRSTRYGANAVILSLLVLVILFLVGFLAERHPLRVDMTDAGEYTLSPKTLNVLQGLSVPIDIYVYYDRATRPAVRDLLTEYTRRNRNLRVRMEDLNKDPELAERFGVSELGTIAFDTGTKVVLLKTFGEEDVTNALIKATRVRSKNVYFVTDHGEKELDERGVFGYSIARDALLRENYTAQTLSLTQTGSIPADCDVLVVAGPKSGYLEQEQLAIRRYLETGGRLLCMFDPRFDCGLEGYVSVWGIAVGNDRVVDPSPTGQLMGGGPTTPLVNRYGVHDITRQFRQPTFFPSVRSVRRLPLYRGSAETASLAFTSEQSWAESDLTSRQISFDENDLRGPVSIAMASRLDLASVDVALEVALQTPRSDDDIRNEEAFEEIGGKSDEESRLVVFGDSEFAANNNFNDMGNGNLFLNAIAWLAEDEELIALRPKRSTSRTVRLSEQQMRMLNIFAVGALPAVIMVLGVLVTWRRRARG